MVYIHTYNIHMYTLYTHTQKYMDGLTSYVAKDERGSPK